MEECSCIVELCFIEMEMLDTIQNCAIITIMEKSLSKMKTWKLRLLNMLWGFPFWIALDFAFGHPVALWSKEGLWCVLAWMFACAYGHFSHVIDLKDKAHE